MLIGIDDTDSPQGMCTTYLGAVLARRLIHEHMRVREARLVRLNPNVTFKTRGNAAIALDVAGDGDHAFAIACAVVEELADFSCENTNPGVVVVNTPPDPAFYTKAVTDFCQIEEAIDLLEADGAKYHGYKNKRGLIGATAAVASVLADSTSEILVYRQPEQWSTPREVCSMRKRQPSRTPGIPWTLQTMLLSACLTHLTRCCLASGVKILHG
jgi:tRNA(Ile2)-agmatinylcytidine synthase